MIFDATGFVGKWPFRKLGKTDISHIMEDHERHGILGGVVSKLESIFYNDPMEGDEELAQVLPSRYKLAITHSPLLPYAVKEITKNPLGAVAVRLFPGYHGYNPKDDVVKEFCRAAASVNLVVYIVARMDDVRLDYIFKQNVPSMVDVAALAQAVPECKFILSGCIVGSLCEQAGIISRCANLYVDTAYANTPPFPFDAIAKALPIERILYATHYPMICLEGGIVAMKHSNLDEMAKKAILHENSRKLFS